MMYTNSPVPSFLKDINHTFMQKRFSNQPDTYQVAPSAIPNIRKRMSSWKKQDIQEFSGRETYEKGDDRILLDPENGRVTIYHLLTGVTVVGGAILVGVSETRKS